jgi:GrpB-like predicted nucleotidyltransferase (UPF0157 family)
MMSIGLKRGTVQITPYSPHWSVEFEDEHQKLLDMLGGKIIAVEHIGSTSVPGLSAKPLIDMIAAISSFDELSDFIEPLQTLGYEYMPERMYLGRKFFPKGPRLKRTHHLNLVLKDDFEQWTSPLLFRDYLRKHKDAREEYAQLKTFLTAQYGHNREAYTKSKGDFIQHILQLAVND